jgi:hypothetical protein
MRVESKNSLKENLVKSIIGILKKKIWPFGVSSRLFGFGGVAIGFRDDFCNLLHIIVATSFQEL